MPRHDPAEATLKDFQDAIAQTWAADVPAPQGVPPEVMTQIVALTTQANRDAGRTMNYGATLTWGVCIGVLVEKARKARETRAIIESMGGSVTPVVRHPE